jgi:hypothetical protein
VNREVNAAAAELVNLMRLNCEPDPSTDIL